MSAAGRRLVHSRGLTTTTNSTHALAARQYFDTIEPHLSIRTKDDWYKVTSLVIKKMGGSSVMRPFQGSHISALIAAYPEHKWELWRFSKVPQRFWKQPQNARSFLEWAGAQLGHTSLADWYQVSISQLQTLSHGTGVFASKRSGNSMIQTLMAAFPEHEWQWWKFKFTSNIMSNDAKRQRQFFHALAAEMKIPRLPEPDDEIKVAETQSSNKNEKDSNNYNSSSSDLRTLDHDEVLFDPWYHISMADVVSRGGRSILTKFRSSLPLALISLFPSFPWRPWKFERVPPGWWADRRNHRIFMEWVGRELGITSALSVDGGSGSGSSLAVVMAPEGWYSVDRTTLNRLGAATMLARYYDSSIPTALLAIFPDWEWQVWRFSHVPPQFWTHLRESQNSRALRTWLEQGVAPVLQINPVDLNSWYRVSQAQLRLAGAHLSLDRVGGLSRALQLAYPNHAWRFDASPARVLSKKAEQRLLKAIVQALLPTELLQEEVTVLAPGHPRGSLELDLFLPKLRLAFEYQGTHHYNDINEPGQSDRRAFVDEIKQASCQREGITLISVPHTLELTEQNIRGLVEATRPDIAL